MREMPANAGLFGRSLTEPYWTTATVKGVIQSVLVQLFERRVLTYTPANPDPYKAVIQPVQHLEVSPVRAYAGDKPQFTGSGFAPNEPIHLWTTDPQNGVLSLIATTSDANGNFTYTYNSRGPLSGVWAITAHDVTSAKEATATFTLTDFVNDNGNDPSIVLSRTHETINDRIDIHGIYFLPNEMFSYWITALDGTVYAGPQTPSFKHVSEYGEVNIHAYQLPKAQSGTWAITIYGQYSHRLEAPYFSYDK